MADTISELLSNSALKTPLSTIIKPTPTSTLFPNSVDNALNALRRDLGNDLLIFLYTKDKNIISLLVRSEMLLQDLRGKIFISDKRIIREFSYIVAPACKAMEGALLLISLNKNIISTTDLDKGISVGAIFKDQNKQEAKAKAFVKPKYKNLVNTIYSNYDLYRNRVLHYDDKFFVNTVKEADDSVRVILKTIKMAFEIFLA